MADPFPPVRLVCSDNNVGRRGLALPFGSEQLPAVQRARPCQVNSLDLRTGGTIGGRSVVKAHSNRRIKVSVRVAGRPTSIHRCHPFISVHLRSSHFARQLYVAPLPAVAELIRSFRLRFELIYAGRERLNAVWTCLPTTRWLAAFHTCVGAGNQ